MVNTRKDTSKRKKNVGFSADAELRARIEAYARKNGFSISVAVRHMLTVFLNENVSISNGKVEREKS